MALIFVEICFVDCCIVNIFACSIFACSTCAWKRVFLETIRSYLVKKNMHRLLSRGLLSGTAAASDRGSALQVKPRSWVRSLQEEPESLMAAEPLLEALTLGHWTPFTRDSVQLPPCLNHYYFQLQVLKYNFKLIDSVSSSKIVFLNRLGVP